MYFSKNSFRRRVSAGITPFASKFGDILASIETYEKHVQSDVSLLQAESRPIFPTPPHPLLTCPGNNLRDKYETGVWLKHADFAADIKNLRDEHVSGTCQWFLDGARYQSWRGRSNVPQAPRLLWVQGGPGCGKSTIAAQVIQDLKTLDQSIVLYAFCKEGEEDKSTLESILGNLTFQLLERSPQGEAAHQFVNDTRLAAKTPSARSEDLWSILQTLLAESGETYCVLDGLDECSGTKEERESFLSRLTRTFTNDRPLCHLMVVSQLDVAEQQEGTPIWQSLRVQPSDVEADIRRFVSVRLDNSRILRTHPEKDRLLNTIVENANSMILWAKLMIGELEYNCWDMPKVLDTPPRGLSSMYDTILSRLRARTDYFEDVQVALKIVLAAARPLTAEELAIAMAVGKGLSDYDEYDRRGNAKAEAETLIRDSGPLLARMPDGTIEFVHSSLREHLLVSSGSGPLPRFRYQDVQVHEQLASIAISYLSFRCFDEEPYKPQWPQEALPPKYSLLEYTSRWMLHHVIRSSQTKDLAEKIITLFRTAQGWRWLERLLETGSHWIEDLQQTASRLRRWARPIEMDCEKRGVLENFLTDLSLRRYEAAKASSTNPLAAMEALGEVFQATGQLQQSESLISDVLEVRRRTLGEEHPDTSKSFKRLSKVYFDRGRLKEAEELRAQLLETYKRLLPPDHPLTLRAMNTLAITYCAQGQLDKAEQLELHVLDVRKGVLGSNHTSTLDSMHTLALVYQSQGRYDRAQELLSQVIEAETRLWGWDHPRTLPMICNSATVYALQGQLKEAEKLYLQVLKTQQEVLGSDHPDTLISMNNLTLLYAYQGHSKRAEELMLQVLKARERVLNLDHPALLRSKSHLARFYLEQGKFDQAEELQIQVLDARKMVCGPDHPHTLDTMSGLAETYRSQGRLQEAEELQVQTLDAYERTLGTGHPETLASMGYLATVYFDQGDLPKAETLGLQVLDGLKRVSGPDDPDTATAMNNLAGTWARQGRVEKAMELMSTAVRIREARLGADHPYTKESVAVLEDLAKLKDWWPSDFPCLEDSATQVQSGQ